MKLLLTIEVVINFICIALVFGQQTHDINLPQCKRSDPNLEKCILDGIESMRGKTNRNDPFKIKSLYADSSIHGAKVHTTLWHLSVSGGSHYKIENLKVDFHSKSKYTGELTLTYPQLNITAHYYKRGTKISYGNFQTYGQFKGSLKNIRTVFKCDASPIRKYGVEYLKLDSVTAKVSVEQGDLQLTPYDKSDIGRKIAMFARTDPSGALQKEGPAIDDVSARLFQQYINEALVTIPLNYILVD